MTATSDDYNERLEKLDIGLDNPARSIEQMVARRQYFPVITEETAKFVQTIETRVAKVNAERGALQQPDELKAVYTTVFDKLITALARAMVNSNKALIEITDSSMRLVDYVSDHRGKLTVSGTQFRTDDAKIQAAVNALIKEHQDVDKRIQDSQREGSRVLGGT